MKKTLIAPFLVFVSTMFFASIAHADFITAIQSGSWGDTNVWDSQTVPGTNDDVFISSGINVTVDTNASVLSISDNTTGGAVTMAPDSTLNIYGEFATDQLTLLDATATGNTVNYLANPFFAKECNYYNLTFSNTNYTGPLPYQDFNNFSRHGATPMHIAGDMTLFGKVQVQQGATITIGGNLNIGKSCRWDTSIADLSVMGDTIMGGYLADLAGADGTNGFHGNMTVTSTSLIWFVSDVVTWFLDGNLTNNGLIYGTGYGSIIFNGTGTIAGSKTIKIPTITVNGTYTIANTIILTTNTPTLNGTLVFDLARTNRLVLLPDAGTPLYYDGALNVINSGVAPVGGNSYKFFEAPSFDGTFTSVTLPTLDGGLSWENNLLSSGSIMVTGGGGGGSPTIMLSQSGSTLTMTWDTATFPGYSVQAKTNSTGVSGGVWVDASSGGVSPFEVQLSSGNPGVYFRLIK